MEHDWAVREMSGANLADPRQVQSVIRICLALEEHPSLSFTAACGPAVRQAGHRIFEHTEGVLIQDREGDIFPLFVAPRPKQLHLPVRAAHDRSIRYETLSTPSAAVEAPVGRSAAPRPDATAVVSAPTGRETPAAAGTAALRTERGHLFAVAAAAPVWGQLRVAVPAKPCGPKQTRQPAREAVLEVRVAEVRLQRPHGDPALAALPREAPVWVIYVEETTAGVDAAERLRWVLLTTLPVTNWAEACEVVGYYARRWTIERLHYTLKSGLGTEKLQIDDAISLGNALALYYVVACRLLQLTYLARHDPEHPALDVLNTDEVAVLSLAEGKPIRTVAEAVLAIAKQGGYAPYRTAPPPGVKVLWLGLQWLQGMALGWRLARSANAGGTAG